MTALPTPMETPAARAAALRRGGPAAAASAWPAAWALAQAALLGVLLLVEGEAAGRGAAALVVAALPGLLGAFGPRGEAWRALHLAACTVAAGLAAALSGGAAGPLAGYLVLPTLVALVLRLHPGWAVAAGVFAATGAALAAWPAGLEPAAAATLGWGAACATGATAAALWARAARPQAAGALAPEGAWRLAAVERERDAALAERDAANDTAAARTRFLAQMSHELRTPLNAIIGFSDIMRTRLFGPMPDRYGEYAGLIHESGEHLLSMINDVLDLAKTEAGRYELRRSTFDAREALNAALRIVRVQADEAGVDLRASPAAAPILVDADERALKQMALNLLANALKFTPRGGHVTAAVAPVGGELQLQVADTGVGVAPADLERLGRPFEQGESARGKGGTGLGLSLVRSFAQLHGGAMTIESRLGAGTAVTVRMPVLLAADAAPQPVAAAGWGSAG